MGHGPAVKLGKDDATSYKTKLGVSMFIVYTLVYAAFVGINAVSPAVMQKVIFGQTLAVVYGMGLIVFALVLAIIYNHFCTAAEKRMNQ
ncbi:MAG: DUF485 domain-containing protein [Desulfuromonadales bacterium]|jgi:uncharacterized membrane protein (DUF485 family)|nr:DUF485 domain-containing protein [Desulfuromonadales bacterium]